MLFWKSKYHEEGRGSGMQSIYGLLTGCGSAVAQMALQSHTEKDLFQPLLLFNWLYQLT